jgi:hypothetical protein
MPFNPALAPGSRYSEPTDFDHYVTMRSPWRAFADWVEWLLLENHRFALIETDSMGCPRTAKPGRITRLWTAPYDTPWDQAGYTYAYIRYEDGSNGREPIITDGTFPRREWFLFFNDEYQRYERTR